MKCANVAFPLCGESVLGMPSIEIEFEFVMVFCFAIRLALYAVYLFIYFFFFVFFVVFLLLFSSLGFTFNTLHDLLKVIVL